MSDNNNPVDPWSNLASELGAEPAPPAAVPARSPAPPSEPRRRRVESAPSLQPASDWGSLASALGITPPPEPVASGTSAESVAETSESATSKPVFRDSVRERLAQGGGRPSSDDAQSGYGDSDAPAGRGESRGRGRGGQEHGGRERGRGRERHGAERRGGEGRGRGGRGRGDERRSEGGGRDRGREADRDDIDTRREQPPQRHEVERGRATEPVARETTSQTGWDDEPWDIEVVESSRAIVEGGFADEPGVSIDFELPRGKDIQAESGSEAGERTGRRRRRRRGGRGRERRGERGGQTAARRDESTSEQHDEFASPYGEFELDESSAGADLRGEFDIEFDDVASEVETSSSVGAARRESPSGKDSEEQRGRRRRRGRRRGRGRTPEEGVDKPRVSEDRESEEGEDLDEVVEYGRAPNGAEPGRTAADAGEDGGFGDELEDDGELVARPTHRGIPSWQETIDVMIANNLEARARNPRGSDGGRGRGGGRSGRGGRGGGRGRSSGG